jgi:hypothetical protein
VQFRANTLQQLKFLQAGSHPDVEDNDDTTV